MDHTSTRYRCPGCGGEFLARAQHREVHCPHCRRTVALTPPVCPESVGPDSDDQGSPHRARRLARALATARLPLWGVVLVSTAIGFAIGHAFRPAAAGGADLSETIVARRIITEEIAAGSLLIFDGQQRARIALGMLADPSRRQLVPSLQIRDAAGQSRLWLGTKPLSPSLDDEAVITLTRPDGRGSLELRQTVFGPQIRATTDPRGQVYHELIHHVLAAAGELD